jgi:hypothetical protein
VTDQLADAQRSLRGSDGLFSISMMATGHDTFSIVIIRESG